MIAESWFLTATERGNAATRLDARHPDGRSWASGNQATPLVHGATYFAELARCLATTRAGDLVLFTDWRGDPDERLTADPACTVSALLCQAAGRGVDVRGLVWRSHLDRLSFSASENRHLGEQVAVRVDGEAGRPVEPGQRAQRREGLTGLRRLRAFRFG